MTRVRYCGQCGGRFEPSLDGTRGGRNLCETCCKEAEIRIDQAITAFKELPLSERRHKNIEVMIMNALPKPREEYRCSRCNIKIGEREEYCFDCAWKLKAAYAEKERLREIERKDKEERLKDKLDNLRGY